MTISEIQQDITRLTERLRTEKPEIYRHLMETPKTVPTADSPDFISQLKGYRETLRSMLG